MNELDRRIAIEVMGEEKPLDLDRKPKGGPICVSSSPGGAWRIRSGGNLSASWEPAPFSTDLDYAMKAYRHYCDTRHRDPALFMEYGHQGDFENPVYRVDHWGDAAEGIGSTLPEAICNLLLALKEEE